MPSKGEKPSFDQFAEFIREWGGISRKKVITPHTRFEKDLGITGDDGIELLKATEKQFGLSLSSRENGYRDTFKLDFKLDFDETLFHGEGFSLGLCELLLPFKSSSLSRVREFTVGELYNGVEVMQDQSGESS